MEESRKVYGWLVRDRNVAVGCSSKKGMAEYGVSQTVEIRSGLISTAYSLELVRIDNFKAGFFAFDKFVTSCRTTYCDIV